MTYYSNITTYFRPLTRRPWTTFLGIGFVFSTLNSISILAIHSITTNIPAPEWMSVEEAHAWQVMSDYADPSLGAYIGPFVFLALFLSSFAFGKDA